MRQGLWGYSSTSVRILQWGVGGVLPGRMVLLWPAPSFNGGFGLACAAIPPAPPSNVFQDRGTPPVPPAGAAPPAPCLGEGMLLSLAAVGALPQFPRGGTWFLSVAALQASELAAVRCIVGTWRDDYNAVRAQSALDNLAPEAFPPWSFSRDSMTRKTNTQAGTENGARPALVVVI